MGLRLKAIILVFCLAAWGCGGEDPGGEGDPELNPPAVAGDGGAADDLPDPEPVVEEKVLEILKSMGEALRAAKRFSIAAEMTDEQFLSSGHAIEMETTVNVTVRRPDGVLVDRVNDDHHRRVYFDGKSVTLTDVGRNLYASKEMTGTLDVLVAKMKERFGFVIPLADLIVMDSDAALGESAVWGTYQGEHRVRGRKCHHMVLANDALEWQLWVQAEGPALPRKLVIIYRDEPAQPRFSALITKWDFETEFPDSTFTFVPPESAAKIDLEKSESAVEEEGR